MFLESEINLSTFQIANKKSRLIANYCEERMGSNQVDLNDGKNFTTMEWLMVFVEVPL